MPHIQAFRGLRYNLGQVGSLSDVIAPPYDVIDSALQDQLYKRHPCNVIRLELNREEPGDDPANNRYTRASRFLKNWIHEGVLETDPDPALYVYHQSFDYAGREFRRRGFMCRVRLERFGEGRIYPHEETHSAAKVDRLLLTRACRANLSQIFGLYPDPDNQVQELLEAQLMEATPLVATDHLGVVHRMWPVTDVTAISQAASLMDGKPMYIADGHHRYETACNYRDELARSQAISASHPANYVLTMCVGMSDPGMVVLPTHRLFRGMPSRSSQEIRQLLGESFETSDAGRGAAVAETIWEDIERRGLQGRLAIYTAKDDAWTVAQITSAGQARMAELSSDHSAEWQELGVALLHRLVIENLLGHEQIPKPMYVHSVEEVVEGLRNGDQVGRDATGQMGQGGRFELAVMVMPATVQHVQAISENGERMPAKSTYFYPKLLSGLVFNSLES